MDSYYYVSTPLLTTLPHKYKNGQDMTIPVSRCIPNMETNVIMVYAMGNTTKVIYRPACIAPGVDTHYIESPTPTCYNQSKKERTYYYELYSA